VILALNGDPLAGSPDQVVSAFGERIKALGAGAKVRLSIRRPSTSIQTFLDESPSGPPRDASGPGVPSILPDLEALLEEHPERLVTVRGKRFSAERELEVTLTARPGAAPVELPPNESLRPRWSAAPLEDSARLAARLIERTAVGEGTLAERYAALRERLERDQGVDDPFRLTTVRYLLRDPLRLGQGTRALAQLRRTFQAPEAGGGAPTGLAALTGAARFHLDANAAGGDSAAPQVPPVGSSPKAHGRYALARVRAAERAVERALAELTDEERAFLTGHLPVLAERFAAHIYLHVDEDPQRRAAHERAVALLPKVDRGALLDGLEALCALADPTYLARLEADLLAAEQRGVRSSGTNGLRGELLYVSNQSGIAIGGSGGNEYRRDFAVVIDLGGDDRYHAHGLAAGRPDRPAAVVIDLSGDDRYQSTSTFSFGAGFLGVGLLVDVSGNDRYTSNQSFTQGAAVAGGGLLVDLAGDDAYRGVRYAQGSALAQGVAGLVDMGGDDEHQAGLYAQGFAGPGSLGLLLAQGGDDRYAALGLVDCGYGDAGTYHAMSQGSAVGFRHYASGGIALLLDEGGRDLYEAGNFSQGGGYYFGWGALVDLGGDPDRYEGSRYAQGFAAHSALGSLWEDGGDDVYRGWVGAQNSAAWDKAVTAFYDAGGDDRYEPGRGFSLGASAHNGLALFVDGGGRDRYRIAPGRAGPNDYHGGPSVSVFVDAGGSDDDYRGGGLADDTLTAHDAAGVVVDLPVALEDVTPAVLKEILGRFDRGD
jgi:hypothetical protein